MDIKREPINRSRRRTIQGLAIAVTLLGLSYWAYSQPAYQASIDAAGLWLEPVQQGDLPLTAIGFGHLESQRQRYLTASSGAVIEEILLKPGANVEPDSLILRLSNPEMEQAVIQAQLSVNAERASLRQLELAQERELLDARNSQLQLQLDLEVARRTFEAEQALADRGIVSRLDFLRTQAQLNKLSAGGQHAEQQLAQLLLLQRQAREIAQEQVEQKLSLWSLTRDQLARLDVRAGIAGILQALPVELGQSVQTGTQLALVGGSEPLLALVQIPQRDMQGMALGMRAQVDTRGGLAHGRVSRIDPIVKQGNIEVEIELSGPLPDNARPSLNVEASIELGRLEQVHYLATPVNAAEHSRFLAFRVAPDGQSAEATWLELGRRSGRFIEITSGASTGERYIVSDMRRYAKQAEIHLIN